MVAEIAVVESVQRRKRVAMHSDSNLKKLLCDKRGIDTAASDSCKEHQELVIQKELLIEIEA